MRYHIDVSRICAIVLNYKNHFDTSKCIQNLQKTDLSHSLDIHLVDNSADGQPVDQFAQLIPAENIYVNSTNTGFSAGNNTILSRFATQDKYDYFLIINPDVTVSRKFFRPLVSLMDQDDNIGIVAPAIKHRFHGLDHYGLDAKMDWRLARPKHINLKYLRRTKPYSCQLVTFACVLIRAETIRAVGPLDDRFFMYFEDTDYCLRTKSAGYKIFLDPTVVVDHQTSSSFSRHIDKIRIIFRSHLAFIYKWLPVHKRLLPILHTLIFYPYLIILGYIKPRQYQM
jgi:GT2 family glycosyltransferase